MNLTAIIPTFNRAHLLRRAVDSALRVCLPGDEIIVIDDGSSDNTGEVVRGYAGRIRYIVTERGGAGAARNRGISEARNPLIAFLDSDDEWAPWGMSLHRASLAAHPEALFSFSNFTVRDRDRVRCEKYLSRWNDDRADWSELFGPGEPFSSIGELPDGMEDFMVHSCDIYPLEIRGNYVLTSSLVVRRERAGAALRFAEDLPVYEDWECFARLARRGKGIFLDCDTVTQHGHGGGRLTDSDVVEKAAARLAILERIWGRDAVYLQDHRGTYRQVQWEVRKQLLRALIRQGDTAQARRQIGKFQECPPSYRLLSMLPSSLTRRVCGMYGKIRGCER